MTIAVTEGRSPTSLGCRSRTTTRRACSPSATTDPDLTRSAEADYYLPLPLGSPLNYFGGDRLEDAVPGHHHASP